MEFVRLGDSGLFVAPIIVGCMSYGSKKSLDWVIEDEEEVFKILKKCYDVGLRTFDTADVYSNGQSEILLGKFIKKYSIPRNRIQILTKCYFPLDEDDLTFDHGKHSVNDINIINKRGLSRRYILEAVEASVKRLGTYIDVLQIHRLDKTPKKEIMRALNDVVEQGHTRYIGASSMRAVEFAELQYVAEMNGWHKFISMQSYYNLLNREDERELIPFCQENQLGKVGLIPWSPIAKGLLARPFGADSSFNRTKANDFGLQAMKLTAEDEIVINRVEELAKKHDLSMAVIATRWSIQKGCQPIVGLNSEKRIDDIVKAVTFTLTSEEMDYLQQPYKPKPLEW